MKHSDLFPTKVRQQQSFKLRRQVLMLTAVALALFGVSIQPLDAQSTLGQVKNLRMTLKDQNTVLFCGDRVEGAKGYMIYLNAEVAATIGQPRTGRAACWEFKPARTRFRGNWAFPKAGVSQFQMVAYDSKAYGPMSDATSITLSFNDSNQWVELTPENIAKCAASRGKAMIVASRDARFAIQGAQFLWTIPEPTFLTKVAAVGATAVAAHETYQAMRATGDFFMCFK